MKNLSQNLNDIKSNLAYNTDQYIKTETNFNVDNNNTEVNMLRNEIFNLKTAFKKMVDLMLEEIDEIKHHILGQTSELQKQDDENQNLVLNKIEVIALKQNKKELKVEELVNQAEYLQDNLEKRFANQEEFCNFNIENLKAGTTEKDSELYETINLQTQQIQNMMRQTTTVEEFMNMSVQSIKSHQQKISEFGSMCFTVEMNSKLIENEMKEFLGEIDKKFELYKESTSGDLLNCINIQKETNKKIEEFANSFTEKEESFEESVTKKLTMFQEEVGAVKDDRKMMNFEKSDKTAVIKEVEQLVKDAVEDVRSYGSKFGGLERKFDNFRNEINTLFVEYENTWNDRFKEQTNQVESIRKKGNNKQKSSGRNSISN